MKTRKLLAIVLAVAMLASFVSIPVFAEGEGATCEALGILVGTGDGVTADYLATAATRAQGALINLRLLGLEADALAFDGEDTFTDAADATEFWQPILEYLKATPSVGWIGYPDGTFMPNAPLTAQALTKVLLTALGYEEGVDFEWDTVMTFAATVGLTALEGEDELTMDDVAAAIVEALGTKTTSLIDVTLLTQLVMDGVIDAADAEAAGFVVEDPAVVIISAGATAVDEITIEMSWTVPEGAVVTLKKGPVGMVANEVVDGTTITLTGLYAFPVGTYTVTVDDETATFDITAQTGTELVIGTEFIYDEGTQDLKISLLDQYDDAMSLTGTTSSIFNQDTGFVFTPAVGTTMTIVPTEDTAMESGDTIYIFVYDPISQLTVTGVVLVKDAPYIVAIVIGDVTLGEEDDDMLFEDTSGNILDVEAIDQYGNVYVLTNSDIDTGMTYSNLVQILSSNGNVISAGGMTVNADGDLVFDADAPGTVMITLIIPDQAFIATSDMITVYADAELTTLNANTPGVPLYVAEDEELIATGFDQYSGEADFGAGDNITFTVTNPSVITPGAIVVGDNTITITPFGAGETTVFYFLSGIMQGQFDLSVQPEAYPFQISDVTVVDGMETGVTITIDDEDIEVRDQYNRVMDDPFTGVWEFLVEADEDNDNLVLAGSGLTYTISTGGLDAGTDTFIAYLEKDGNKILGGAFDFDVANVDSEDIDGFEMADISGPMYVESVLVYNQDAEDYYKTVAITGTIGEMSIALYDGNGDGLPDIIDLLTSTNDKVEIVSGSILVPESTTDLAGSSTTIKAWRNGEVVAMTDLDLSDSDPDLTTIEIGTGNIDWQNNYTFMLTAFVYYDQYGVELDPVNLIMMDMLIYEYPDSAGDWGIVSENEMWWFTVIKYDGTVWKVRYIPLEDILPQS